MPARDRTNVVGTAVFTGWPRQVVLAVVQLAHDDGAVDVAIDKVHQHFGAGSVNTAPQLGPATPWATRTQVPLLASPRAWPVDCAHGVGASQSAIDGRGAAPPGELDAHATIAVGGDWVAYIGMDSGDHDGSLGLGPMQGAAGSGTRRTSAGTAWKWLR